MTASTGITSAAWILQLESHPNREDINGTVMIVKGRWNRPALLLMKALSHLQWR